MSRHLQLLDGILLDETQTSKRTWLGRFTLQIMIEHQDWIPKMQNKQRDLICLAKTCSAQKREAPNTMVSYQKRGSIHFTLEDWLQFFTMDMMIFACWLASWIVLGHKVKVSMVEWTDWNTYLVGQMWLLIWMKLHFNHFMLWINPFTSGSLKVQVGDFFIVQQFFVHLFGMFFLVKTVTPFEDCWWPPTFGGFPVEVFPWMTGTVMKVNSFQQPRWAKLHLRKYTPEIQKKIIWTKHQAMFFSGCCQVNLPGCIVFCIKIWHATNPGQVGAPDLFTSRGGRGVFGIGTQPESNGHWLIKKSNGDIL